MPIPFNKTIRQVLSDRRERELRPKVERAVARVRALVATRKPQIKDSFFYGAMGIDPKHLVVWYIFSTDSEKEEAEGNGLVRELEQQSRDVLREEGYPSDVLDRIYISFASEEEIQRAGGFREFFA